ncbi:MAG: hypothetical protein A2V66_08235 [Ignavibacteria bacterium RBG_13_36_8]|nr:MAG: hypothetical protein A2V66_08235 [Ignavibacteria bacterium RBG_13_36_8]
MKKIYFIDLCKNFLCSFLLIISLTGCLGDITVPPVDFGINSTAELLLYLEENGDYINSTETYSIITAEEVFNSLNEILVLDIRTSGDYTNGHIEGSVNLNHSALLDYIININPDTYEKIVIVSSAGQSASYYATLLRLYGISNIYVLKYGMASWHADFASIWLNEIQDAGITETFNNIYNEKNNFTVLPSLSFTNSQIGIEGKLGERIDILLQEDFNELGANSTVSITLDRLYNNNFDYFEQRFTDTYLICASWDLYYYAQTGILDNPGHPPTTVLYNTIVPWYELRSTLYLQTLPIDETIVIYDYNGHISATLTAYLRLLGYNAKSILFGYNGMHYSRMLEFPIFSNYTFTTAEIKNFPYVK